MAVKPSQGLFLYHITHINNIESILKYGLLSREKVRELGSNSFTDIADPEIMRKRELTNSGLSQFVLFHFFSKNPFDCAVCNKYGSSNMVIITIKRELAKTNDFMIIPSHPLDRSEPKVYPYEEGLSHIKWEILDNLENRNYFVPEIKKACMAECVMKYVIPCEAFARVFVYDDAAQARVRSFINADKLSIQVAPYMFP